MVDAALGVVYLLQMAPGRLGNPLHEVLGLAFVILFVTHHLLNHGWFGRLGRQHGPMPRPTLVVDVLLTVCATSVALTGVLMSRSVLPALSVPALAHLARPLHGASSYAGLMAVSLHVGMHMRVIRRYMGLRGKPQAGKISTIALAITSLVPGVWAFLQLGVMAKLTGRPGFPDALTPLPLQLVEHIALVLPFVALGSMVSEAMFYAKQKESRREHDKDGHDA